MVSQGCGRRRYGAFSRRLTALLTLASFLSAQTSRADLIAGWDFQTTTNGGTAVVASPSTPKVYVANFGTGTLYLDGTQGSSDWLQATELNAFSGSSINATNGLSTTTTSPAALAVLGGTSNAANGKSAVFKFSMTGYQDLVISLAAQRTSTGFTTQAWEFSTDGTSYTSIGSLAGGSAAGTIASSFTTSGVLTLATVTGLNNASTAYVRVTFTGATAASGNNRLDNFQFNASTYTPPSATYTWTGTGSGGSWTNGQQGSFNTTYANSSTGSAVFAGTGEAVTVAAGGVETGSMSFQSNGFSLTGGTVTMGQGTITVDAATTASVLSVVAGTAGITKAGPGTLLLDAANTVTGNVTVSAGTLEINSDSDLGDSANDVVVNGTLRTPNTLALGAGRDLSGSGTLDIAAATTLTVNGAANLTSLTLANSGTLSLQGSTRSVGSLTLNAAATVQAAGAVSVSGLTASGLSSGTATIAPALVFTTGDKTVNVPGTGRLVLQGDVSGLVNNRLAKTGSGTLVVDGPISSGGLRVGATASTPTDGGTVILGQASSAGSNTLQLNFGTLSTTATGGIVTTQGLSVGGRTNGVAVLGGSEPMTFNGQSSFFRGTGTTGALRLDVNNETTLGGGFAATSGSGTATGITIGGSGKLTLAGDGSALVEAITLQNSLDLLVEGSLGSAVTVGATNAIGGDGTIAGALTLNAGAGFVFDAAKTLTVNGASVSFGDFGVSDLIGFSAAVPDGTYTLIDGLAAVSTANLRNLGSANAYDLGSGRSAYFETGSLVLKVVPEPSSVVLAGLGGLLAAGYAARRRRPLGKG
jgi:autotransporter-associated beta strand protein